MVQGARQGNTNNIIFWDGKGKRIANSLQSLVRESKNDRSSITVLKREAEPTESSWLEDLTASPKKPSLLYKDDLEHLLTCCDMPPHKGDRTS